MPLRPRYRAGIISSMAELTAEYSPLMPGPAMNRVAQKPYWMTRGLSLRAVTAAVVASSRLRCALTSSGGVRPSH